MMSRALEKNGPDIIILHASCVSYNGRGVLILGESGAGKSSLALQLMGYGADLVADDQTVLTAANGILNATAPAAIQGLIEARGVGLLTSDHVENTIVELVIDLNHEEQQRLPEHHHMELAGVTVVCLHKVDSPHFPASILQYLKSGRRDP